MSTAGQPLSGRHGVLAYSAQTAQGTPVTPALPVGLADFDMADDANLQELFALGSAEPQFLKGGMAQVAVSLPNVHLQSGAFLKQCIRTGGVLPFLTLAYGYMDDAGTKWAKQVQDVKIGSVDLNVEQGGPLTASFSGIGGLVTELSGLSGIAPVIDGDNEPFYWYEGVLTKGGSAFEAAGLKLQINHNLQAKAVIPGAALPAGQERLWKYLTEGRQQVAGEVTLFGKQGQSMQAAEIAEAGISLAMTSKGAGAQTIVISLTGAKFGSEKFAGARDGDLTFSYPFIAKRITIA